MKDLSVTVNPPARMLRIDLRGPLSAIPNTQSGRRNAKNGQNFRDPKKVAHLTEMFWKFHSETRMIRPLVKYGNIPVHVTLICGERYTKRGHKIPKWDDHNLCKSVGDWLQEVGVIDNDSNAEIQAIKRVNYFSLPDGRADDRPFTTIIVEPLSNFHRMRASLIYATNSASLELQPDFEPQSLPKGFNEQGKKEEPHGFGKTNEIR